MAGVLIPVSLYVENLLKIINDLKSSLGNLKVGSSGFKQMENHIGVLQKELDKFLILASKPFVSENLFVNAEKSVDKLEEEIERVSLTASRLKFSDLELNGELKSLLKAVEDEINSIRASFKALKDEAKLSFLKTAEGDLWANKMHPEDKSRSLELMTNNIRKEVKELNEILEKAEELVAKYKRAIAMGDAVKAMNKARGKDKDPEALKALMGTEFSTFFKEIKGGKILFQTGLLSLFAAWLEKNFAVDESVVRGILKKSAPEIAAALNDTGSDLRKLLLNAKVRGDSARIKLPGAETDAASEKAKLLELTGILNAATGATDNMKVSEELLQLALTAAGIKLESTKDAITADVRAKEEWRNVNQRGTAELELLRTTLQLTNALFLQLQRITSNFNSMKMAVVNFMGFRLVLNITKNAIREAINHIKELDTVMNKISIVTDMDTSDLWAQVDQYSAMAQLYGTTIKGAYEVSLIYYQQGLETNDVLTLTNETLKLAKVSGLDYATTTDYMTTALRGFKMEMSEASTVVDVYSNLAAHTAVSLEELAVAMSKTASSMESVGSTFEESSAMIATMVAVTRESATNIGSALKSIASRYGEMKSDPLKLIDSEGDIMSFNKVDAALLSVGISMKTADGLFRSFTEVILELSEKWDQLESTQLRYIATLFAGNRQQSRFLALVSNPELLLSNLSYAEESEDTGTLLALKALDSIESKLNLVLVAYLQFYTTIGIENVWKGLLDGAKNVINTLNGLPKLFGKLPIAAIGAITGVISLLKDLAFKALTNIAEVLGGGLSTGLGMAEPLAKSGAERIFNSMIEAIKGKLNDARLAGEEAGKAAVEGAQLGAEGAKPQNLSPELLKIFDDKSNILSSFDRATSIFGSGPIDYDVVAQSMQTVGTLSDEIWEKISTGEIDAKEYLTLYINETKNAIGALLNLKEGASSTNETLSNTGNKFTSFMKSHGKGISTFGQALNMAGMLVNTTTMSGKVLSGGLMGLGGAFSLAGIAALAFNKTLKSIPWMAIASGVFAVINSISQLISAFSAEAKLEELTKKAEELSNKAKEVKANYRTLDTSIKKINELNEKRYESKEAAEEYLLAVDDLTEKYPLLIKGFDAMGNVILDTASMEDTLTEARRNAAEAAYAAAKAEAERAKQDLLVKLNNLNSLIGSIKALPDQLNTRLLARYLNENGMWETIDAHGGGTSLHEKLKNQDLLSYSELRLLQYIEELPEQFLTDGNILAKLMTLIGEEASSGNYNLAALLANVFKMAYETMNWQMPDYIELPLESLVSSLKELGPLTDTIEIANKQMVNSWLRSSKYMDMSFISSNSGLSNLFLNLLYQQANGNYSESHLEQLATTLLDEPLQFWESLNEDELTLFNKMFTDTKNYTKEDFKSEFGDKAFFPAIENLLETYYNPDIATILNRANAKLALTMGKEADENGQFEKIQYNTNGITEAQKKLLWIASHLLTLTEELFYNSVIDLYESLNTSGYTRTATDFVTSAAELYSLVSSAPAQIEALLWELINTNGLNTLEGLLKIKDSITNNSELSQYVDTNILDRLQNNIIPNINLEILTAISNLLETWEDTSKELSSALSGGVSLKEADALINKAKSLGVDLDLKSFDLVGDKLVLAGLNFEQYFKAMTASAVTQAEEWLKKIDDAKLINNNLLFSGADAYKLLMNSESDRKILDSIGFLYNNASYWGIDGKLSFEGIKALLEAIQKNLQALNEYNDASGIAAKLLLQSYNWTQGNYFDYTIEKDDGSSEIYESIVNSVEEIETMIANDIADHFEKNTELRAMLDNIYESYDKLLSDVLSKGFENFDLDDYEGIISEDKTRLQGFIDNKSYTGLIQTYAKFAGKSIDETNELIALAIEKERETTSSEILSNLQFINQNQFTASLSDLTELANKFNVDLSKLTTRWSSDLGAYVVNITDIDGLDLSLIENSKAIINDSINAFFDDLVGLIKSALDGSLSNVDRTKLLNWVANYNQLFGENLQLDFTRTAEGLLLSEQSAIGLYNALEQVDSLQASLVFDELNKSLKENNDHYKSVSDILVRIKYLNDLLANPEVSTRRREEYEAELAVAEKILRVRSTAEDDSFNFMSNKIPAAQNNPLNYFSNWALAWKTLTESSKSGTIDYTAFYNIVTEMGNLAEKSGAITVGAGTVLHNSEDAAALIDAAAQSLRVDANGELTVDLSNLANLGFNFEAAGADMSKGVDAGIKEIALSQIKMLDGMIQLMETIVAMEELGKVDLDNNNTLDLNEIFKVKYDANGFQLNEKYWDQFTDSFKEIAAKILKDSESNKDLTAALQDVVINGYSLHDIFLDAIDGAKDLPIDAEAYTAIMNAFYRAAISGDYDLDNIMASIQSVLASNGYEGNIDVGNMHITIHQGVTLLRDENGNYIVDGESYKDIDTATKALQASAIGEFTNAIKKTNPKTGDVTYTAGELSATVLYDIESKKYHVKFSDGTSADADDIAGARFAILAWAQMNDTDLSEMAPENAEGLKLSFTYNTEAGVTMNIEADVTTGKVTYTHSGAPDLEAGLVVLDLQLKIGKVTVPVTTTPESTPGALTVTVTTEGVDTALAALDKLLKTLEDIESKSNITININSDGTTTTNNNSPLVKEVLAKIIEYINGEGEKANPAQLVSDLHAIITNYADPESNKAELLRALTAYITSYDDSKATQPTLDELTEFITKINTEGADAALEEWRRKLEEKKVNILIESETKENVDAKYNDIRKAVSHVDYNPSSGEAVRKNELAKIDKLGLDLVNWTPTEYALGGINEAAEGAPNLKQYVTYLQDLVTSGLALGNVDISNLEELLKIPLIAEDAKLIQDILDTNMLLTLNLSPDMFNSALEALTNVIAIAQLAGEEAGNAKDKAEELKTSLDTSISVEVETETATSKIASLLNAWDNWMPKNKSLSVNAGGYGGPGRAGGNIGQANAKGTLMGELGPELVVSNGRYFVAGLNGPEMIDLADDAIVFNHLLTKSLLEKGMSSGRGKVVTNERNAVAFATGSIHGGPAMASASAALQALKQLRSQWQSLLGLSMQDLAGAGGSGGGGGGDNKAFIKELERWYNWLLKIAQLEKLINYYEADRNRISSEWRANGYKYFDDLKKTIDALSLQLEIQKDLTLSQEEYFEKRRAELNSDKNPFSSLYSFNEQGQILYKSGKFEELSNMVGTNKYNNPNMSAQEQYEYIIKNLGIDEKYFEYDASGNKIEADDYTAKILKFWDLIESDKEEMLSGYDAVLEGYIKLQELLKLQNDLLKEMRDNQMDLELKIYDAVVDIRLRAIDELSDTKDAIQESNEKFIEGLSKALEKERNMYDNKLAADDLDKLRRQRDILVRSGGSASEIASLNEQISEQEQSAYFDKLQEQIDAIQEASDKQIEKLEAEISLQTEILEYLKKHGLLWAEVTDIMGRSPEEIARFIAENDSSYWDKSPVSSADALNLLLFLSELWAAYREEGGEILTKVAEIAKKLADIYGEKEKKDEDGKPGKETGEEGQGLGEGQGQGEGQGEGKEDGKKKKYKATVTYYKGSGATGTSVGIGIADTIDGAKAEAYKRAINNIPANAVDLGGVQYEEMLYKNGGYNYNTGLAMLHGTSSKPEAVLNAEQTKVLRDNILSNKPDSLISLLKTYNDITHGLSSSTYSSIANQNSSLVIEKAEVNLNVDKLANDYDSRLAAATIMDEMLRIASKTKANNSVRR